MISAADRSAGDPSKFRNGFMRDFASAMNTTAESLSLDYSQVNYSSARAALVDIWRGIIAERSLFCSSVASLILDAVLEECVVKGWLPLPAGAPSFNQEREAYTRCQWTGPAMGWVDPLKEATASVLRTNPTGAAVDADPRSCGAGHVVR
jgi:capsid protein